MFSTSSTSRLLATGLLATLLAACGGGGGNPGTTTGSGSGSGSGSGGVTTGASAVEKYLGTWSMCTQVSIGDARSVRDRLTFAKSSETTMTVAATSTFFTSVDCSGGAGQTATINSTVALAGTKTINGETVDKVDVTNSGGTSKDVLRIRTDGKLYTGNPGGGSDADGYPIALDPVGLTRE